MNKKLEEAVNLALKEKMQKLAKKGGNKTKKRYGPEYYKNLGKKGAAKRWGENA